MKEQQVPGILKLKVTEVNAARASAYDKSKNGSVTHSQICVFCLKLIKTEKA